MRAHVCERLHRHLLAYSYAITLGNVLATQLFESLALGLRHEHQVDDKACVHVTYEYIQRRKIRDE